VFNLWVGHRRASAQNKSEADVRDTLTHILIFLIALVAISALAIWFNLGPVAYSAAG